MKQTVIATAACILILLVLVCIPAAVVLICHYFYVGDLVELDRLIRITMAWSVVCIGGTLLLIILFP